MAYDFLNYNSLHLTRQDKSDNVIVTSIYKPLQLKKHAPICKLPAILERLISSK